MAIVGRAVYRNKIASLVYVLLGTFTMGFGILWGTWFSRFDLTWSIIGSAIALLLLLVPMGQGLFVEVRVSPETIVIWSPFRYVRLKRSQILSAELCERTADEAEKHLLSQGSSLTLHLVDGGKVSVFGFEVRILRELKEKISTDRAPV